MERGRRGRERKEDFAHEETTTEKLKQPTPSLVSGISKRGSGSHDLLPKTSRNPSCVPLCEEMEEARVCWDPVP